MFKKYKIENTKAVIKLNYLSGHAGPLVNSDLITLSDI